ncbi:ABC transporter permease [Anaerosphaera multitolerans]|uniref:ABC transporter permease n=1 Tax=Anaerosphaera multitolerans TaxID=2487351 RepID=A0A437S8Y1_9FIRM|nr:ABC transporter permease [Anaerosphaera multitolerans]RVU55556.1 hypothetical protein EF514_02170 [Anaerosphaera multitolerans]
MDINIYKIEKKKYKGSNLALMLLFFIVLNLGLIGTLIFSREFQSTMNFTGYSWLNIMDSYFMYKVILNPILLSVLVSKSVDMENQGNMWKYLKSCGVDFKKIYKVKFQYIFRLYFIYQCLEWLMIIILSKSIGLRETMPIYRMSIYFVKQLSISYLLMAIHYLAAIKWENQLVTISISLIGTVVGVISMFLPIVFSNLVPYSWYVTMISLQYNYVARNEYYISIRDVNYFPLLIAVVLGTVFYKLGEKYFKEAEG